MKKREGGFGGRKLLAVAMGVVQHTRPLQAHGAVPRADADLLISGCPPPHLLSLLLTLLPATAL